MKTVGQRLVEIRKQFKLNQKQLGELMGVSFQQIHKYEKDLNIPDVEKIKKLAEKLKIPAESILGLETKQPVVSNDLNMTVNVFSGKAPVSEINKDAMSFIPLMTTKAAATPAVLEVSDGQTDGGIYVPAEIVNKYDDIRAYTVFGNSMNSELHDGDIVAVAHYTFPPDLYSLDRNKIYLCNIEDWLGIGYTLKRARIVDGRYLNLISDNKEYDPMILDLYDENRTYPPIAGHVVWMSRKY